MPNKYARKLAAKLAPDPAAFLAALEAGKSARPAVLWLGESVESPFESLPPPPWQPAFVEAMADGERPGRNPLHDQGAYYCLDLSSVFEASALCGLPSGGTVVDVCAAPGGKTIFAHRALAPERLIANEVIGKRLGPLTGNLRRCQVPAETRCADPSVLATELAGQARVVLVDAPCSGQSLLARGQDNPGAFHPVNVNSCANRQKRILAESVGLLAPGGFLLYSTCTYATEENEEVVAWLLSRFPELMAQELPSHAAHRSPHASFPSYRLWPDEGRGFGAGGFVALLQLSGIQKCV
ncbi:RsmB/NOP family class I SAM-dependent RNA methyltransferase [Armatimonas rosea]|uniref:16S rRNA C967 or C1407 C5-methylase (RsmB/RsmF family) n=1 Tax=Armatimonas rosea TaxID=685828 RepID=A0A7W9SS62_ARMRO|nr:RsmB/NOP family class I SAM-dependent RNA methyltransferase [Armatimonas rosea]MBB6051204.1 16S rRNA C967 or C1407 C5-methylase (RsmB/RsmF family) [Armatimonas rosea]